MSSLKETYKSFDFFRRLPADLTESSFSGAAMSLATSTVLVLLVLTEFANYMDTRVTSVMELQQPGEGFNNLEMFINITLPRAPCNVLSLDVQDIMGSHVVDFRGNLEKVRLDRNGNEIGKLPHMRSKSIVNVKEILTDAQKAF